MTAKFQILSSLIDDWIRSYESEDNSEKLSIAIRLLIFYDSITNITLSYIDKLAIEDAYRYWELFGNPVY